MDNNILRLIQSNIKETRANRDTSKLFLIFTQLIYKYFKLNFFKLACEQIVVHGSQSYYRRLPALGSNLRF